MESLLLVFRSMSRVLRQVVCWCHLLLWFVASVSCSAFYFLRAVFEMLHCLQKGLSTAAAVALPLWHHSVLGSWRYECPTFCGNHGSNPMMFSTLYDQCQGYFGCLHFWWNWLLYIDFRLCVLFLFLLCCFLFICLFPYYTRIMQLFG